MNATSTLGTGCTAQNTNASSVRERKVVKPTKSTHGISRNTAESRGTLRYEQWERIREASYIWRRLACTLSCIQGKARAGTSLEPWHDGNRIPQ
jgi:hypothetical protein